MSDDGESVADQRIPISWWCESGGSRSDKLVVTGVIDGKRVRAIIPADTPNWQIGEVALPLLLAESTRA